MFHQPVTKRHTKRVTSGLTIVSAVAFAAALGIPSSAMAVVPSSHADAKHGDKVVAAKPAWVARTKAIGAPAASAKHRLSVVLVTDHAGASAYAKSVSDPKSPNYRKFLTPAQYAKKFGASADAIHAATKWLKGQGFTVGAVDAGRTTLAATGTTTTVNKAFGVGLKSFKREKATVTAPTAEATVPTSATSIRYVVGLDTTPLYHTDHVTRAEMDAKYTQAVTDKTGLRNATAAAAGGSVSGDGCSHYWGEQVPPYQVENKPPLTGELPTAMCGYTPKELNKVQKVDKVKQTGKGVTVGFTLWCDAPTLTADMNKWSGQMGMPKLKTDQVSISRSGEPYDPYCSDGSGSRSYTEVALDAEAIHGTAPDAKIVYSSGEAPYSSALIDATHRLVDANSVDIISNSWGGKEADMDDTTKAAFDAVYTQAAAQGITVLASSGDAGDGGFGTAAPAPDFPASNPWITSVGGTNIGSTKDGKVAFESAWWTVRAEEQVGQWDPWVFMGAGGGGTSKSYAQPYYQKGVVPAKFAGATPMRVYPDLANIADPDTGYLVGYTAPSTVYSVGSVGGTSLASPRTAGQLAVALEKTGKRIGFLNPAIYSGGAKHLTDLKSNAVSHAAISFDPFILIPGLPALPMNTVLNAQSLTQRTLTLDKGFDNLSGMGAVDDQTKLTALIDPKN